MDVKSLHWSEQLAERVIKESSEPYVITAGITTSGPAHLGTLCEFLFPSAIKEALTKKGKKAKFYFLADILDAFDSVPLAMEEYTAELSSHLGKPLCNVPDPTGKSKSFGDHFLDEVRELMKTFKIDAEIVRINDAYNEGKFDNLAIFFLKNEAQARELIERTSGKIEKKDWSPIMPICKKCGKIATTIVTYHDGESYRYRCDRDVKYTKGCGYEGEAKITDHQYKIVWRLHWPSWMKIYGTHIEGAGVDHHTRGGSWDTCVAVFREMFKKEPPIGYKYGFILFQGKKYSKSKGIGMGVSDMIRLLPPEIIKYLLLKPDLQENIDINPTPENLLRAFDDFQEAATLSQKTKVLHRSEEKRVLAYRLCTEKQRWKAQFLDVLLYYQIYRDWEIVGKMLNDKEGVNYLAPYIKEWIARGFIPNDYQFKYSPVKPTDEKVLSFFKKLDKNMNALEIHNLVFEHARESGIEPKELFKKLYLALIGKEKGPRIGKLLFALDIKKIQKDMLGE